MLDRKGPVLLASALVAGAAILLLSRLHEPPKKTRRASRLVARPSGPHALPRLAHAAPSSPEPAPAAEPGIDELVDELRQLEEQNASEIPEQLADEAQDLLSSETGIAFLRASSREDAEERLDALLLAYAASLGPRRRALPQDVDRVAAEVLGAVAVDPNATEHARALAAAALGGLGTPRATAAAANLLRNEGEGPAAEEAAAALASRGNGPGHAALLDVAASDLPAAHVAHDALDRAAREDVAVARDLVEQARTQTSPEAALAAASAAEPAARENGDLAADLARIAIERAALEPGGGPWHGLAMRLAPPPPPSMDGLDDLGEGEDDRGER
jgi:hypothetical protein